MSRRPGGVEALCDFIITMNGENTYHGINRQETFEVLTSTLPPEGMKRLVILNFYERLFLKDLDWSISGGSLTTSTNYMAAMDDKATKESMSGYFSVRRENIEGQLVPTIIDMGSTIVEGQNMVQFISRYRIGAEDMEDLRVFARNAVLKPCDDDKLPEYDAGYLYTVKENGEYVEVKETDYMNEWRPETVIGTVEIDEFFEAMTSKDDERLATCDFKSFQKSASDTRRRIN